MLGLKLNHVSKRGPSQSEGSYHLVLPMNRRVIFEQAEIQGPLVSGEKKKIT